jgi:hypothetical protein
MVVRECKTVRAIVDFESTPLYVYMCVAMRFAHTRPYIGVDSMRTIDFDPHTFICSILNGATCIYTYIGGDGRAIVLDPQHMCICVCIYMQHTLPGDSRGYS